MVFYSGSKDRTMQPVIVFLAWIPYSLARVQVLFKACAKQSKMPAFKGSKNVQEWIDGIHASRLSVSAPIVLVVLRS